MERRFDTPDQIITNIEPYVVEDQDGATMKLYSKEDAIRLARAFSKEMAKQVLYEADGGFEQNGNGYIPQKKYAEVLAFINEQ